MGEEGLRTVVWGGTSSVIASALPPRFEGADLVVLDFGDCDRELDPNLRRQSFEGCLRQVLSLPSRPRVACLPGFAEQKILADHYGVPLSAEAASTSPSACPDQPRNLRDPLYSSDWQFVRLWDPEASSDAELVFRVTGKVVGVLASGGGTLPPLEVGIDAPPTAFPVIPGGAFLPLARGLSDGEHVVRIRQAAPVRLITAGVTDSGRRFVSGPGATGPRTAPADLPLVWTGRFDPADRPGATFGWQGSRLSGRFTGPRLSLWFSEVVDRNFFDVVVDGRARLLELLDTSACVTVADDLGPGDHRLEVVKRSEGLFGSATLAGLALAPGERWLNPGARPTYRLEVYGDSISAGACNEDGAVDQYDTLATHDPSLSYGAIAARRLGAEIVNLAVSGTGLTCSWNAILLPDVWDRVAPRLDAPRVDADRVPHVVVLNLGQNDYGFPHSQGLPFDPAYGPRLQALVLGLRARYPDTWIVGALGGMTGWKECEPLRRLWRTTFDDLQAADPRVRAFFFQAASSAHPRVDVHALLAEELTAFLAREVWPHLETPLH